MSDTRRSSAAAPGSLGTLSNVGARAGAGSLVTLGAQAIKLVMQLGALAWLARLLSPADFGLMAMVLASTGLFTLLKDGGLTMAVLQSEELDHHTSSALFWVSQALGVLLALLTIALAPLLVWLFDAPELLWLTVGFSCNFLITGLAMQHQALLARDLRFGALAAVELLGIAVGAVAGIIFAHLGYGYFALLAMLLVQNAIITLGSWLASRWRPGAPGLPRRALSLLRMGGVFTATGIANYLSRNVDDLLIGWYWSATPLGYYSQAYRLLMVPLRQVNDPLNRVVIPALSAAKGDPERFRNRYLQLFRGVHYATLPLIAVLVAYCDVVVTIVLGRDWLPVVPIFEALAVAAFLQPTHHALGWLYVAQGNSDGFFRVGVVSALAISAAFCVAVPFGVIAVAWAFSAVLAVLILPLFVFACRNTSLAVGDLIQALIPPATLAATLYVVALLARGALLEAQDSGLLANGLGLVLALVVTAGVALTWPTSRRQILDVLTFIRTLRGTP